MADLAPVSRSTYQDRAASAAGLWYLSGDGLHRHKRFRTRRAARVGGREGLCAAMTVVLVVEDERELARLIERELRAAGYAVLRAEGGR